MRSRFVKVTASAEQDIWFVGVMVPGPDQFVRVVGTWPSPPSVGTSGGHSDQETIFEGFGTLVRGI